MEVVDACSTLLSNQEVLELLRNNLSKKHTNLATILYETTSYLESCPPNTPQSLANLAQFLDVVKAKQFHLTKFEKVQIANLKPQNETELHLIVDNIEERLTEEQRNDLLALIQNTLNKPCSKEETARKKIKF